MSWVSTAWVYVAAGLVAYAAWIWRELRNAPDDPAESETARGKEA